MAFSLFQKFFKKQEHDETELNKFYSQKVIKSEQVDRPGFDNYFNEVIEAEAAYWGDDGYLYQPSYEGEDILVTFGRFNDRMNNAVCSYFGKEKCKKVAKVRGWHYDYLVSPANILIGSISYREDSWPVKWYELHDALVNL